jgi:hypothetical protein
MDNEKELICRNFSLARQMLIVLAIIEYIRVSHVTNEETFESNPGETLGKV